MAIAADTYGTGTAYAQHNAGLTSLTYAFNNVAGNLLIVGVMNHTGDGLPTVTYNGVSMTRVNTQQAGSSVLQGSLYYLLSPATGSNNIVVTQTGTNYLYAAAASYSGVKQSGQPDSSNTATGTGVTSLTASTTVVASNCWLVEVSLSDNGNPSGAGAGTVSRSYENTSTYIGIFDSNGTVGTGSQSLVSTIPVSGSMGAVIISVAPSVAVATLPYRSLLGVGI